MYEVLYRCLQGAPRSHESTIHFDIPTTDVRVGKEKGKGRIRLNERHSQGSLQAA